MSVSKRIEPGTLFLFTPGFYIPVGYAYTDDDGFIRYVSLHVDRLGRADCGGHVDLYSEVHYGEADSAQRDARLWSPT